MYDKVSPQIPCSHTLCLVSIVRHVPDARKVWSQPTPSPKIQSTPSLVLSVLTVCLFALKLCVSVIRLYCGKRSIRSLLEAGLCSILSIAGVLLLVFSILLNKKALEVLLSLIGSLMFLHQCGLLWQFFDWPIWALTSAVVLQVLCAVFTVVLSTLIAASEGSTETWRITILSLFVAEYIILNTLYLGKVRRLRDPGSQKEECKGLWCVGRKFLSNLFNKQQTCLRCILWWNVLFCAIAWLLALVSLGLYLLGQFNYMVSQWVDVAAAIAWIFRWLVMQSYALGEESILSRADSLQDLAPRNPGLSDSLNDGGFLDGCHSTSSESLSQTYASSLPSIQFTEPLSEPPSDQIDIKQYHNSWKDLERQNRARLGLPLVEQHTKNELG